MTPLFFIVPEKISLSETCNKPGETSSACSLADDEIKPAILADTWVMDGSDFEEDIENGALPPAGTT